MAPSGSPHPEEVDIAMWQGQCPEEVKDSTVWQGQRPKEVDSARWGGQRPEEVDNSTVRCVLGPGTETGKSVRRLEEEPFVQRPSVCYSLRSTNKTANYMGLFGPSLSCLGFTPFFFYGFRMFFFIGTQFFIH